MQSTLPDELEKIKTNNASQHEDSLKETLESFGHGDLTFEEFSKLTPDRNEDQSRAGQFIEAQEMVLNLLEVQKELAKESWSNDDLIKMVDNEKNTESVQRVCRRIHRLRESGNPVESDRLLKSLKDAAKRIGVLAKTVDALLDKEAPIKAEKASKVDLPFDVLGFNKERKVLLWHKGHQMHIPILSLKSELEMLWGITEDEMKAITSLIREKGLIDEETPIRVGIWQLPEWKASGKILIVSGRGGIFFQNGVFTQLEGPVVDDQAILFERRPWIDLAALQTHNPDVNKTFEQLRTILSEWPWIHPDAADWMTAFVMVMPFQQLMSWRPWLWLDGSSNSGKSAFFNEFLEQLYGNLLKRADKATAHSLMQSVGNSGNIPILDEFEKYKHNDEVLTTCKVMCRGGVKTSGTTGQSELSFHLHHIPIFGSIYLPRTFITDLSQRNRVIRLSLGKVSRRKRVISSDEMRLLGVSAIASTLSIWKEIKSVASQILSETSQIVEGFGGELSSRAVENFMYAAAILKIVTGKPHTVPDWARQEQIDDGLTIIEAIVRQKIRDDIGHEHLVQDLIEVACGEPENATNSAEDRANKPVHLNALIANKILRLNGLRVVNSKNGTRRLALRPEMVSKELLKGDDEFKGLDLTEPLLRIAGAENKRTSWGSKSDKKPYAIQVPIGCVLPDKDVSSSDENV